jgi:hypothetical protein
MKEESKPVIQDQPTPMEKWTYKGKPLRILSTSLGVALVANMLLMSSAYGAETPNPTPADGPKLVEASSEQVKKFYDPNVDWNIPVPFDDKGQPVAETGAGTGAAAADGGSNNTTVINNGGGYGGGGIGWTELLLFHMIFNRGNAFSSNQWSNSRPVFDSRTNRLHRILFRTNRLQAHPLDRRLLNQAVLFQRNPINQALPLKAALAVNPVALAQVNPAVLLLGADYDI